jgi:hypothetical protein
MKISMQINDGPKQQAFDVEEGKPFTFIHVDKVSVPEGSGKHFLFKFEDGVGNVFLMEIEQDE